MFYWLYEDGTILPVMAGGDGPHPPALSLQHHQSLHAALDGGGGGGGGTDFDRCRAGGGSQAFCAAQFPDGGGSDITGAAPPGSKWVAAGAGLQNLVGPDGTIFATRSLPTGDGDGAAARTQFASERELDLAQAKSTLQQAQAALKNAQTSRDQLAIQRAQNKLDAARLAFDKAQAAIENVLNRDTLNASIAATKQRLEEIELEARLAFESQDKLLTKRLQAEKEMLELRLDNDFRELLTTEIGAERRVLIQEQGETRRLVAQTLGKDEFRAAALLGGQVQRGRTPAQRFGQQNQAFLNQPLPQANFSAPFPTGGAGTGDPAIRAQALAALQAQLTGAQNRPLQPQAPVVGLAAGGVIEMSKSNGAFSMKPQSFFVGEVNGRVIPGITEIMTIGDGKVTVSPLMGGLQTGGTLSGGTTISPATLPAPTVDPNVPPVGIEVGTFNTINPFEQTRQITGLVRVEGRNEFFYITPDGTRYLVSASALKLFDTSQAQTLSSFAGFPLASEPLTAQNMVSVLGPEGGFRLVTTADRSEVFLVQDTPDGPVRHLLSASALAFFDSSQIETVGSLAEFGPLAGEALSGANFLNFLTAPAPSGPPAEVPPVEPPVVTPPGETPPPVDTGPTGPSPQDILAGLQALAPGFAGLTEFVPRTQTGQFGGVNALRDFFSLQGQNFVQDPFSGQFRPFLPGLPEGATPSPIPGAPTSFGAPVVNPGAFNLQNLATLGFDPALVRLGGQEDIFYRDPTTGELRQFGTPDIFEQSGFNLADVFNISPTGQNFQFGSAITSPLPLQPNANTSGPFRQPLIDPFTGALLFDPFQNASSLLQLQQSNPSAFLNLLSSFGTAGLNEIGFQSRLDLATPTGALDNPLRIGFTGTRL